MNRLYLLSDVHLGIGAREEELVKKRRLLTLLEEIREDGGRLVIAGDLFDFWFEYRYVVPRGYHAILAAIEKIAERPESVSYFVGNHDFAAGSVFTDDLGVKVYRKEDRIEHDGKIFFIHHGDGLAHRDGRYRLMKRIIRSRCAMRMFGLLHPDAGFGTARIFSKSSRDSASTRFFGESDGMREEARRRIREGADFVVMGHRHVPALEKIESGWYINLGDWLTHFSYAVYENGAVQLFTLKNDRPEPLRA
jgi:UDP-2,3-diacylglucosamine hydrolase